jgi:aryl-phospho-beta-D-glucosidase BglC (GH1 family)
MSRADKGWAFWTSNKTVLRGANVYQQEINGNPWCSKAAQRDFDALRDAGANLVDPPYTPNPRFLDELTRLVALARAAHLFAVISFRTGPGRGEEDITGDTKMPRRALFADRDAQKHFLDMWTRVARLFKDVEHVIGYDLLVEPHQVTDDPQPEVFRKQWRSLAAETVGAIRKVDPDTPILASPDQGGTPASLATWGPLFEPEAEPAKKIAYTVHQYDPYAYTHNDPKSGTTAFDPSYAALKEALRQIQVFRERWGVPLAVNEFGVKFRQPRSAAFLHEELKLLEQHGLNHAVWIWELAEGSCADGEFGVNDPAATSRLAVLKDNWRSNGVHP